MIELYKKKKKQNIYISTNYILYIQYMFAYRVLLHKSTIKAQYNWIHLWSRSYSDDLYTMESARVA